MTKHQLLNLLYTEIRELMGRLSVDEIIRNKKLMNQIEVTLINIEKLIRK